MAIKELEYPFDPDYILRKKKAIKRQLTEREGVSYTDKKIAILGGSTTSDIKLILELFLLNYGIRPEFYESEYNQYYEDAVFGNEELDKFSPDLVFIHTTSRNITAYPSVTDSEEDVKALADQTMARFTQIWGKLHHTVHGCGSFPYNKVYRNLLRQAIQQGHGFRILSVNYHGHTFSAAIRHDAYESLNHGRTADRHQRFGLTESLGCQTAALTC